MSQALYEMLNRSVDEPAAVSLKNVFSNAAVLEDVARHAHYLNDDLKRVSLVFYASVRPNGGEVDYKAVSGKLESFLHSVKGELDGGSYFSDFEITIPATDVKKLAEQDFSDDVLYSTSIHGFPGFRVAYE